MRHPAARAAGKFSRSIGESLQLDKRPRATTQIWQPRMKGARDTTIQNYYRSLIQITKPLDQLDDDQSVDHGITRPEPPRRALHPDRSLPIAGPRGRHIVTIGVRSQLCQLATGDWDGIKDAVADRVVERLGDAFPNLPGSILHREVLSPLGLERRLALTGGNHNHSDVEPDQLFFLRPVRGHADDRIPLEGLCLCGAGRHPDGGVSGANGRNCARQLIRDSMRGWRK